MLDRELTQLATFLRRVGSSGVVAQLVEHHNGIVSSGLRAQPIDPLHEHSSLYACNDLHALQRKSSSSPSVVHPSLRDAVTSLIAAKTVARRRPAYIRSLRQYLTQFIRGRESDPIASISHSDVEKWFLDRGESAAGQASNVGRLSALFSFSIRRGWIDANPCLRLERITVDRHPPRILSAEESSRLLSVCGPSIRPWVVLGLFAGLRPSEAEAMDWSAIRIFCDRTTLTVDAAASKVRRRRIVPLLPAACAWLSLDRVEAGPVVSSHSTLRRARREAAMASGIEWSADVLRHTYASMRMGAGGNASDVAGEMGNSPGILLTHYRELVTTPDAQRFWSIRP